MPIQSSNPPDSSRYSVMMRPPPPLPRGPPPPPPRAPTAGNTPRPPPPLPGRVQPALPSSVDATTMEALPNNAYLWQQEMFSDVDLVICVQDASSDSSPTTLQTLPAHRAALGNSPVLRAQVGRTAAGGWLPCRRCVVNHQPPCCFSLPHADAVASREQGWPRRHHQHHAGEHQHWHHHLSIQAAVCAHPAVRVAPACSAGSAGWIVWRQAREAAAVRARSSSCMQPSWPISWSCPQPVLRQCTCWLLQPRAHQA